MERGRLDLRGACMGVSWRCWAGVGVARMGPLHSGVVACRLMPVLKWTLAAMWSMQLKSGMGQNNNSTLCYDHMPNVAPLIGQGIVVPVVSPGPSARMHE